MELPLIKAPFDTPLLLLSIQGAELERLLSRLGLYRGQTLVRQDEEVLQRPVRIRSEKGEVVLGGGMAMRVIVHLDDGRKLPLSDMTAGQQGHIEGITCSMRLAQTLKILGLDENHPITFLRQLPPMDYMVSTAKGGRARISEGMAAKIWGRSGEHPGQFVSAGKGQTFAVEKILGGERAADALAKEGIVTGSTIELVSVAPAQTFMVGGNEPVVITNDDGLHLHLRPGQAEHIRVEPKDQ